MATAAAAMATAAADDAMTTAYAGGGSEVCANEDYGRGRDPMDSAREWKLATAMAGGLSRMACGDDAGDECAMAMAVSAMLSPMAAMTMAAVAMATAHNPPGS